LAVRGGVLISPYGVSTSFSSSFIGTVRPPPTSTLAGSASIYLYLYSLQTAWPTATQGCLIISTMYVVPLMISGPSKVAQCSSAQIGNSARFCGGKFETTPIDSSSLVVGSSTPVPCNQHCNPRSYRLEPDRSGSNTTMSDQPV
jgi:hypothetical protein